MQKFYGGGAAASGAVLPEQNGRLVVSQLQEVVPARAALGAHHDLRSPSSSSRRRSTWCIRSRASRRELFFPVSGALSKTPTETWREYGALFRHLDIAVTPELLAALAQVEAAGNPVARAVARARVGGSARALPAGLRARWACTRSPTARSAKPGATASATTSPSRTGCWLNSLAMRVIPSHAVEMTRPISTAAWPRCSPAGACARRAAEAGPRRAHPPVRRARGELFVRNGFRLMPGQRCGEHDARAYLAQVNAMKRVFARLSALG